MKKKPSKDAVVSTTDTFTILICADGHSASKTITRADNGEINIKGFNAGRDFGAILRTVAGIEDLSAYLMALEKMPNALVIRGGPIAEPDANGRYFRRKTHLATPARGRCWVLIDLDKLPVPEGLDLHKDTKAVIEHLVHQLPAEFHNVSYHYQVSSSAGLKDTRTVSAHLWFWLTAPRTDAELKRWGKAVNATTGSNLVDTALFNDVQAHYTAAPCFDGVADPFPKRSGLVTKAHSAVELQISKVKPPSAQKRGGNTLPVASSGFKKRLASIGDHAGGEGFHLAVISAIASYVAQHGKENVDPEALYVVIRECVLAANRTKHDDAYIETMASREHIMPAITGALAKFGDAVPASRRKSRMVKDIAPPPARDALSNTDAHAQLSTLLDQCMGTPQK